MTFKTGRTITTDEVLRPSDVYSQGKEAVEQALKGFKIIDFRFPIYGLDSYLSADRLKVEGPFLNHTSTGTAPRFIVIPVEFPEWE